MEALLQRAAPALAAIPLTIGMIALAHIVADPLSDIVNSWNAGSQLPLSVATVVAIEKIMYFWIVGVWRCLLYFAACGIDYVITVGALVVQILGECIARWLDGVAVAMRLWPLWLGVPAIIAVIEFCAPPAVKLWLAAVRGSAPVVAAH